MRFLLSMLVLICLVGCKEQKQESAVTNDIDNPQIEDAPSFDWLLGSWKRVSKDTTSTTFEIWSKEGETFKGHGFVMQQNDTVWQEHMVLHQSKEQWILSVETPGNDDRVDFKMTDFVTNGFTVENPEHDYPQIISYSKGGGFLTARISGGDQSALFEFKPLK